MLPPLRIMKSIEDYYKRKCEMAHEDGTVPEFTGCYKVSSHLPSTLKY